MAEGSALHSDEQRLAEGNAHLRYLAGLDPCHGQFAAQALRQSSMGAKRPLYLYMIAVPVEVIPDSSRTSNSYVDFTDDVEARLEFHNDASVDASAGTRAPAYGIGKWSLVAAVYLPPERDFSAQQLRRFARTTFRRRTQRLIGMMVLARLLKCQAFIARSAVLDETWSSAPDLEAFCHAAQTSICMQDPADAQVPGMVEVTLGLVHTYLAAHIEAVRAKLESKVLAAPTAPRPESDAASDSGLCDGASASSESCSAPVIPPRPRKRPTTTAGSTLGAPG